MFTVKLREDGWFEKGSPEDIKKNPQFKSTVIPLIYLEKQELKTQLLAIGKKPTRAEIEEALKVIEGGHIGFEGKLKILKRNQ